MLRKADFVAIALLVAVWAALTALLNALLSASAVFPLIFVTAAFSAFAALLVRRIGAVILFMFAASSVAYLFGLLPPFGVNPVPVLAAAGFVFELVYVIIRAEFRSVPINLLGAAGLSGASIPWAMLLLSNTEAAGLLSAAANFSLSAFFIGVAGAVASFAAWYEVKSTRAVIRYEYAV